ncbi:M56 family metallopeptidase [Neolewinella antarctica]|uniref:Beta-lactamase regulating signal transducer with metallopeptidase domain n=1 Tax=Neolewinella antarctica TaxID=442734 RepID=A0ABX0XF72_9BACT|nr:M56 family metallopeptidase [Neolewinella antarctica]NJC27867.1 beta-lactamase regulating signal transducer with metallopeptidase domain [Neolewinella antarctica]
MSTSPSFLFFEALAISLLHSCWIFTLLVGTGYALAQLSKTAKHRYVIYLGTLVSLPVAFCLTYVMAWRTSTAAWADATWLGDTLGNQATLALTDNLSKLGIDLVVGWTDYLAGAYLIGLFASLTWGAQRYWITRKIRRGGLLPAPPLRALFADLRKEMAVSDAVRWKVTDRVREVLTVGILRPVILFPVGLVNSLTTDEVSAILRHELNHIRRNDPFWNAVQELTVRLFFYHPLVYWLAGKINLEREFACDDAVIPHVGKTVYARALLRVAQYSLHPKQAFTMAAIDHNSFTYRIQRLFSPSGQSSLRPGFGRKRSYLLATLAIVPLCFTLAYGASDASQRGWLAADNSLISLQATERTITGTVTDGETGQPLIGTTVIVEGTNVGAVTNLEGAFEIRIPAGEQTLVFAYVGYETVRATAPADDGRLNVTMTKGSTDGDAVLKFRTADGEQKTYRTTGEKPLLRMDEKILIVINGKPVKDKSELNVDPDTIASINVIKAPEEMKARGYDLEKYEGAILITLKK